MKKFGILGSTGSIGTQTLEVIRRFSEEYSLTYLTTNGNIELLVKQIEIFKPEYVCIAREELEPDLRDALGNTAVHISSGRNALLDLAANNEVDLVMNGLVGGAGMEPTIKAISAGVDVALSNKESLVMAGGIINNLLQIHGTQLFPVDSEHSAIWQCLTGEDHADIKKIILTGSGGPFRTKPIETFEHITKGEALKHPNWDMGAKITIDSATMMNKGLEVIEAHWLFHLPASAIEIVVHPQSIIHSMVEFADGSVKAQLGLPDMKIPIQYALTYPHHLPADWERLDLTQIGELTFESPDLNKFHCIQLAYEALEKGGTAPAALNSANDEAVAAFLNGAIPFHQIPNILEEAINNHEFDSDPDILAIQEVSTQISKFIQDKLSVTA
ncbi:MAG: 1-deoxy-D-xylulose-5-phosphate reductoisomerase [Candidatus Marinimicrobia bacterium]|nr:1-deoxy-D-xylulose-5-phosphate reductoisomerase [Candidatus Neomarinimicrobiota bacterium]